MVGVSKTHKPICGLMFISFDPSATSRACGVDDFEYFSQMLDILSGFIENDPSYEGDTTQ